MAGGCRISLCFFSWPPWAKTPKSQPKPRGHNGGTNSECFHCRVRSRWARVATSQGSGHCQPLLTPLAMPQLCGRLGANCVPAGRRSWAAWYTEGPGSLVSLVTHQPGHQLIQAQAILGRHGTQHLRDGLAGLRLESHRSVNRHQIQPGQRGRNKHTSATCACNPHADALRREHSSTHGVAITREAQVPQGEPAGGFSRAWGLPGRSQPARSGHPTGRPCAGAARRGSPAGSVTLWPRALLPLPSSQWGCWPSSPSRVEASRASGQKWPCGSGNLMEPAAALLLPE